MKILVLLAGVADIRFALHPITLNSEEQLQEQGAPRRLLSPFDEAALEVALKLRDAQAETQVDVLLFDGANSENLLRAVAAFRPNTVHCLELQPMRLWDARFSAAQLVDVIARDYPTHDLVLLGREMGDLDEGSIAPLLACRLARPLFAMAQFGQWKEQRLQLMRERGICEEWLDVDEPMVASVTNDRRNKLRHPIMKNVMEAKRMSFARVVATVREPARLMLTDLQVAPVTSRGGHCQLLQGDDTEKAQALVGWLKAQGVNA